MKLAVALCLVTPCFAQFVINTWSGPFEAATAGAFSKLIETDNPLDAIETGCAICEQNQCDGSVGYGNHPDTTGYTSLDALIMDGDSFDAGSVAYIRKFRNVISIARAVMYYTSETLLVGHGAEEFARMVGIPEQDASTKASVQEYKEWKDDNNCQPNFYDNIPEATTSCGPYNVTYDPQSIKRIYDQKTWTADQSNHDTIGMVVINSNGSMACGTSTNGANHKVAGRVGDSPIIGAGCYVDSSVGGAAATGDGDVMMRFLPSFNAVQLMSQGLAPQAACEKAFEKMVAKFPSFSGGMVCVNNAGVHAGVTHNMNFSYSYQSKDMDAVGVVQVQ